MPDPTPNVHTPNVHTPNVPTPNVHVQTDDGVPVAGYVAPGFEGVCDAFVANFAIPLDPLNAMILGPGLAESGSAVSIFHHGRKVVDLWGGFDRLSGPAPVPYPADALQLVFSTTKGITAIAANLLVQRGLLDLDAPVTHYWPEFGQNGKDVIPVRWLLCHRGGIPWTDEPMTFEEALVWDNVTASIERQVPAWKPGDQHGYHATTYGWLVGEVIRRVTGMSVGEFIDTEFRQPLGLDLWLGLPEAQHARVVPLEVIALPDDPMMGPMVDQFIGPEVPLGRALFSPGGAWREKMFESFNEPALWSAQIPAANGITDARSLAKLYAATVGAVTDPDGTVHDRVLSAETVAAAATPQTEGADHVLMGMELQYGLGFNLAGPMLTLGGPNSFGHYGAGGSVGFADPDVELGFAYVMNKMYLGFSGDPRSSSLIAAAYDAIGR